MSKKIVILNGSPRSTGNTIQLTRAFTEGAGEAGHSVIEFQLDKMNIGGCRGCLAGGDNPESPCTRKDDMDRIYPAYRDADIVVFASPLYFWSFSGQLKTAIDRLFAVTEANQWQTPHKSCVMLIAAESDAEQNFAPMVDYYHSLVKFLAWKDLGMVLAGGVLRIGDIEGKPVLEETRKFGRSLV